MYGWKDERMEGEFVDEMENEWMVGEMDGWMDGWKIKFLSE